MKVIFKNNAVYYLYGFLLTILSGCNDEDGYKKIERVNNQIFTKSFNCSSPELNSKSIDGVVNIGKDLVNRLCNLRSISTKVISQVYLGDIIKGADSLRTNTKNNKKFKFYYSINYLSDSSDGVCIRYKYDSETKDVHIVGYASLRSRNKLSPEVKND